MLYSRAILVAIFVCAWGAGPGTQPLHAGMRDSYDFVQDRADSFKLGLTDIGEIRLVLSNAGTFGDRFFSRNNVGMEFPAHTGIEHLVRAGVWIGAIHAATGDTMVSIGAHDAFYLDPIVDDTEFTPVEPEPPQTSSRLPSSPYYRPGTISDENTRTVYVDSIQFTKTTPEEPHTPMGVRVVQNTYAWGFSPYDQFIIVQLDVINHGDAELQDLWIGVYSEMVTNNRNYFRNWPPGGVWFDFQLPQWHADLRLLSNHNARGDVTGATQWAGVKVVGSGGSGPRGRGPDSLATKQISLTAWSWNPSRFLDATDDSLYQVMNTGVAEFPPGFPDPDNTDINPVAVLSVGPFASLAPGDTAQVVFAFVAGEDEVQLRDAARWAQSAYDNKYDVEVPVTVSNLAATAVDGSVVVTWELSDATLSDLESIRIQRAFDAHGPYEFLDHAPLAARASMRFEDTAIQPGRVYWYRLVLLERPGDHVVTSAPVSVEMPDAARRARLSIAYEASGAIRIRYEIAEPADAVRLYIVDVAGRRVRSLASGAHGPGVYDVTWEKRDDGGRSVARGIYFVRLAGARVTTFERIVLLR